MGVTAIYARVSTDEQAEHGTSLDEQIRLCRQRVPGDETVMQFVDAGLSGTTLQRPELQSLLQRARLGQVARLIAFDPDRLSRNAAHLLTLVDELRASGVRIEFVNFAADLSPDGRLLFTVRGAISEFEAHRIKQRMYSGKQARARANRVAAGTCIYGYRLDRSAKAWVEEPHEAQVVRLLFEWATAAGTHEIARRLNGQGVVARFGGPWSQSSVRGIVRNPTYLGQMRQMGGLGAVTMPALVSPAQFQHTQEALDERRNRPPGRRKHPYLLTGRLVCGGCGRSMCGGYGRSTRNGVTTYYGCAAKGRRGADDSPCTPRYWRSDVLDREIWGAVLTFVREPAALHGAARAPDDGDRGLAHLRAQQHSIERERERLAAERERIARGFRRGVLSDDEVRRQRQELDAEEAVLVQRAALVGAGLRATDVRADDVRRAEQAVTSIVADAAEVAGLDVRRAILQAMGVRVTAGPGDAVRVRVGVPEAGAGSGPPDSPRR